MNRHITHIILWAFAIIVMAACGGGGSDVPSPAPTPTPTPTPTNPTNPDPEPEPTPPIPEPTPEPQPVAIGFRADLSDAVASTRNDPGDGVLDDAGLKAKGFGVFCWYTGKDNFTTPKASRLPDATYTMLMRNQKVEYVGTQWTYSPSKYWPIDSKEMLTFRAYAPYTDYIVTDDNGMPQLPVVVDKDDYHNGSQYDPLWGTGKHDGTLDSHDAETDNEVYGKLYDNYTYTMSGDKLAADGRDGVIDWYFHHGMAMLVFKAKLEDKSSDAEVYITNITISPLYNQGLLSISSTATSNSDKPTWSEKSGGMTVSLDGWNGTQSVDLTYYTIGKSELTQLTYPGLLVIPRNFKSPNTPLTITVTYKRSLEEAKDFTVTTTIDTQEFLGNTIYTLNLTVGSALIAKIESVNVAKTKWNDKEGKEHEVYNW